MGLNEKDSGPIYLACYKGKLTLKSKVPTEKTFTRVNKQGDTVHELQFDSISGLITGLGIKDSDYGKQLTIKIWDEEIDQDYMVNVPLSSGYSYGIFKRIGNIDFSRILKLKPYNIIDATSEKSGFVVYQDDDKVPMFFSKENPGGVPEWTKVIVRGEEKWDDTASLNFFINLIKKDVLPQIKLNAEMSGFGKTPTSTTDLHDEEDPLVQATRLQGSGNSPIDPLKAAGLDLDEGDSVGKPNADFDKKNGKAKATTKVEPIVNADGIDDLPFIWLLLPFIGLGVGLLQASPII